MNDFFDWYKKDRQFLRKVKKGKGYAIIEEGQFQLYVGVFEKLS